MPRVADIFLHTPDIMETRRFYGETIGLYESIFSEEHRHLVYRLSTEPEIFLVIMENKDIPFQSNWDNGPVFREGNGYNISFSIRMEDSNMFKKSVDEISRNFSTFYEVPQWVGYWSFIVKDPAGTTIDLYYEPSVRPKGSPSWELD